MKKIIREVEWSQVKYRLEQISRTDILKMNFDCYIANMGGLSKDDFERLKTRSDLDFIRAERFKPKSFLQKIIVSILSNYWIVAKVKNLSDINNILDKMTEQAMAEIYIINHKSESEFNSKIAAIKNPLDISDFIEEFPDAFMYQLDADSDESKTGMVEIISYGDECPKSLIDISELTFFR